MMAIGVGAGVGGGVGGAVLIALIVFFVVKKKRSGLPAYAKVS